MKKILMSILFAFLYVIGESYKKYYCFKISLKLAFLFLAATFISYVLISLIDKYFSKISVNKKTKLKFLFDDYPILLILIILLCYTPFIILKYPGSPGWDFFYIFRQCFQGRIDMHFQIVYVYIHKFILQLGINSHNLDFSVFILTIIQLGIFLYTMYETFKYLKKWNINYKYRLFLLLFYSLNPLFLNYSMTLYSDVTLACFFTLYILILTDFVKCKKCNILKLVIFTILIICTKNSGIYIILPTSIYLSYCYFKNNKKVAFLIILPVVLTFITNKVLGNYYCQDTSASYLSIPIQNISNYSNKYHSDISKEQKRKINKIFDYDKAGKYYNPKIVDNSRDNAFNYKNESSADLNNFIKVWIELFFKHPDAYIDSFINNTYQLYYPFENTTFLFSYYKDTLILDNIKVDNYFIEKNTKNRNKIYKFNKNISKTKIIRYIDDPGIYVWLFLLLIIVLRKKNSVLPLIPLCMNILGILTGPAIDYNGRYAFPIIYSILILYAFYSYLERGD